MCWYSSSVNIDNKKKDTLILGKHPTNELDDTKLTSKKEFSMNFIWQQKKFCLGLHYNWSNSYKFVNSVELYYFKAKHSKVNTALLYLYNVSKDFLVDNIKKRWDYMGMSLNFQLIMIDLILMINIHQYLMKIRMKNND